MKRKMKAENQKNDDNIVKEITVRSVSESSFYANEGTTCIEYVAVQNDIKVHGMIYDEEKESNEDYLPAIEKHLKEVSLIPIGTLSPKAQEVMKNFSEDMYFFEKEEWSEEAAMAVFNELVEAGIADSFTECGKDYYATLYGSYQCKMNYAEELA